MKLQRHVGIVDDICQINLSCDKFERAFACTNYQVGHASTDYSYFIKTWFEE
jgi:hypothetical protein